MRGRTGRPPLLLFGFCLLVFAPVVFVLQAVFFAWLLTLPSAFGFVPGVANVLDAAIELAYLLVSMLVVVSPIAVLFTRCHLSYDESAQEFCKKYTVFGVDVMRQQFAGRVRVQKRRTAANTNKSRRSYYIVVWVIGEDEQEKRVVAPLESVLFRLDRFS